MRDGHASSAMEIICGVSQGSILGPPMFLSYINDLLECLQNATSGLYADDTQIQPRTQGLSQRKTLGTRLTQIYASSASFSELVLKFNQDLENISQNKLQLHSEKTNVVFIGSPYMTEKTKLAMNK